MEFDFHLLWDHHRFQIKINGPPYIFLFLDLVWLLLLQFLLLHSNFQSICRVYKHTKGPLECHQFLLSNNPKDFILDFLVYFSKPTQSYQGCVPHQLIGIISKLLEDPTPFHGEMQPCPINSSLHNIELLAVFPPKRMPSYVQHMNPSHCSSKQEQKPPLSYQPLSKIQQPQPLNLFFHNIEQP